MSVDCIPYRFCCPRCGTNFSNHTLIYNYYRDNKETQVNDSLIISLCPICNNVDTSRKL